MAGFLVTGMMVADFRQGGMVARVRERLKIFVKTPASWLAQALCTLPDTLSGPAAFFVSFRKYNRCKLLFKNAKFKISV